MEYLDIFFNLFIKYKFSLSLSAGDLENLERAFEVPNDNLRINYKTLIEEIETVFTVKVKNLIRFIDNIYL